MASHPCSRSGRFLKSVKETVAGGWVGMDASAGNAIFVRLKKDNFRKRGKILGADYHRMNMFVIRNAVHSG